MAKVVTIQPQALVALGANPSTAVEMAPHLSAAMTQHGINTENRVVHFLAQGMHESDLMRSFAEVGVNPASYGGFPGGGFMQITFRSNYEAYYADLRRRYGASAPNVVANPALLRRPDLAADSAGWWWKMAGCNDRADAGTSYSAVLSVSTRVNCWSTCGTESGLPNGLAHRVALTGTAEEAVSSSLSIRDTSGQPGYDNTPNQYFGTLEGLLNGMWGGFTSFLGNDDPNCIGLTCGGYSPSPPEGIDPNDPTRPRVGFVNPDGSVTIPSSIATYPGSNAMAVLRGQVPFTSAPITTQILLAGGAGLAAALLVRATS